MKKLLALILAALMCVVCFAACGSTNTTDEPVADDTGASTTAADTDAEKTISIGVFEPSTGDSASGGKKETLGVQYANSKTPTVEVNGETYTVKLEIVDNGSSTDKAPTAASQLVGKDVCMVLGSYGSGVSMAGGPIFDEAGLCALGITCTNPNVTAGNDYYNRICFLDNFQADVLASFAKEKLNAKVAYCLGENGNEYDQGLISFFTKVFEENGGTVIADSFPTNNSDFTSYLNKAKNENADIIFTPVSIAYATQIVTQAESLGVEAALLGSDTLDDNMVLDAAKGTSVKLYVSTFYQEGGSADFDNGIKEYINSNADAKTANGGDDVISAVTAMGYDAYYVALEAIKAANSTDKADIKAALGSVTYSGVSGDIAFDAQGDAVRDTAYIKTVNTTDGVWTLETVQTGSGK